MPLTHRDYFLKFNLSVEQYGEILVAEALGEKKLGDTQPCYDVACDQTRFAKLLGSNTSSEPETVRIEVKSKMSQHGNATVVKCGEIKFNGKGKHEGMTHLVIVIVDDGTEIGGVEARGDVKHAWLMDAKTAKRFKRSGGNGEGNEPYISVPDVETHAQSEGVRCIKDQLNLIATMAIG